MRILTALFTFLFLLPAYAGVSVGGKAPDFTLPAASGSDVSLSDYAGKIVILEWHNPGCPYVKKFYDSNAMQALQSSYAGDEGVVWLSINSGAEGLQGHMATAAEAAELVAEYNSQADEYLLDHSGEVGKAYGAATTPHIYVINADGRLAYQGAIDSIPSGDPSDIEKAENYLVAAVTALAEGEEVETKVSQPYGCSVKYAR